MKSWYIPFALIGCLLLLACGPAKIETVTSTSPQGDKTIVVTGDQAAPLDPIMVTVKVTVAGGESDFSTEFFANELTADNCLIDWETNDRGTITLITRDNEEKVLEFFLQDDEVKVINKFYN